MVSRSLQDDLKLELKLRLMPVLEKDFNFHSRVNINFFYIETIQAGWKDEWRSFSVQDLFTILRPDQGQPKAWVVAGTVGSGKTALARAVLQSWLAHNLKFTLIEKYKGIFVIDGEELEKDKTLSQIQSLLPDTVRHWGVDRLFEWLEEARILLVVDDFLLDTDQEAKLMALLDEWKGAETLLFTSLEDGSRSAELVNAIKPALFCRFSKLHLQSQSHIAHYIMKEASNHEDGLFRGTSFLRECRSLELLFESFGGLRDYCQFTNEFLKSNWQKSLTSFLWESIYARLNAVCQSSSLAGEKLNEWLLILGKRCFDCLAGNAPLLGEEVLPLFEATSYLFPEILSASCLVEALLLPRQCLYSDETVYCVSHRMQQEVLAAFYLLRKNMDGMPLKRMLKIIKKDDVYDDLAVYVAGLLTKLVTDEGKFFKPMDQDPKRKEKKIERVLRNLSLQREFSPDPTTFTLRILHELEYREELVSIFLQDVVIPSQLHVHELGIYAKALDILFQHSYPSKVHLLMRRSYKAPELYEVLQMIKDHDVNLALMDMNLLEWEDKSRSDEQLQILFDAKSVKLQDFIGCLDESTISKLHLKEATRHLVCLRVRICDNRAAKSLAETKDHLPHLMWLEIDFDFPLDEVFALNLPPISVPLIDFSFRNITDADIERLCDFLYSISRQYAGLHIHQSSVSPQGVTELLKYFFRRNMSLTADLKTISKYRKYRFPELSSVPKKELDDTEVELLLGYADRHHYSDNEVWSSCVSTHQEVDPLKYFFSLIELTYFVYSCANFQVTKETSGDCHVTSRRLI